MFVIVVSICGLFVCRRIGRICILGTLSSGVKREEFLIRQKPSVNSYSYFLNLLLLTTQFLKKNAFSLPFALGIIISQPGSA